METMELYSDPVYNLKWIAVGVIATSAFIGSLAAWFLKGLQAEKALKLSHAFAGGVFLGVGLVDMLADSQEQLAKVYGNSLGEMLCGLGFLLSLSIDTWVSNNHLSGTLYWEEQLPLLQSNNLKDYEQCFSKSFILILVLAFHSLMGGIALGSSNVNTFYNVFFAIVAHKGLASFALGDKLLNLGVTKVQYVILMAMFTTVTPLGIMIGMLMETSFNYSLSTSMVQAVASGTFLHIGVVETIHSVVVFEKSNFVYYKLIAITLGYMVIATATLWA